MLVVMTDKLSLNIKSIPIQAIENSLLSPSSLLSQLREFCLEVAALTGHTEKESKERVAHTVIRLTSCLKYLHKNLNLEPKSLKRYSNTVLELEDIVNNEWGFVPQNMKQLIKKSIYSLNVLFDSIKPIKSYLPLKSRIAYNFNLALKNIVNNYQKELDDINHNLKKLIIVIEKADIKPLSEVTKWKTEALSRNYSELAEAALKSYEKMPQDQQKEISDYIIQNIIEYGKEIDPNNKNIKEIEEIRNFDTAKKYTDRAEPELYPDLETRNYIQHQTKLYEQQKPELMKKYADMYIIFENGKVIDYDKDEAALVLRAYAKTEPKHLFVKKVVLQEPTLTARLPFKLN